MLPFLLPNHTLAPNGTLRHVSKALKGASRIRCIEQRAAIPSSSRNFASSANEDGEDDVSDVQTTVERSGEHLRWLRGPEGQSFRRPREDGPNWLGGSVPFPLNPSFKPPPPITDKLRTEIFNKHLKQGKTEEDLSGEYKLGINRIRAILRLKKLEQLWVMNKTCHHQFQTSMERYLGAQIAYDKTRQAAREAANRIDVDVHTHSIGESKRLQRVYFEMVPEGQNPPLAQHLDLAQAMTEEAQATQAENKKAHSSRHLTVAPVTLLKEDGTQYQSATKFKWFYPAKAGRTPYTFVNVGDRYARAGAKMKKKVKADTKGKKVAPKVPGQSHRLQLALEALKVQAEQRTISEEIATREAMRLKRQQTAKQELANAQQKVSTVDIQL